MKNKKLGSLCQELFLTNLMVYEYENKKWWGRKNKTATSIQIDVWDRKSREWNEKRSNLKKTIDLLISKKVKISSNKPKAAAGMATQTFNAIPISLMIDMLIIENLKVVDLKNKGQGENAKRSLTKIAELKRMIDASLEKIMRDRRYAITPEARTF